VIDETEWARVARHLAGEETPEEAEATKRWIEAVPERQVVVGRLTGIWTAAAAPPRRWDSQAAWQRVVAQERRDGRTAAPRAPTTPAVPERAPAWRWLAGAAAVLVVAAGIGLTMSRRVATPVERPSVTASEQEYHTAPGQRAVVHLADGTSVELGVESSLRVRAWSGPTREVHLEGEAAFTVVHDSTRPFLVYSRNAIAEDLGTRFAVRAYREDPGVRVVVASGEVAVADSARRSRRVLDAGDEAAVDAGGRVAVRHNVDTTSMLAWMHDRFVMQGAPLRDVARQLERWFDVRVDIQDSAAASSRVTINMPATRLTDILGAATTPLGLVYSYAGRSVVIRRPVSQQSPESVSSRRSEP
jgi:ferric-dicitrate binding protein FerR (iron transport regulator)